MELKVFLKNEERSLAWLARHLGITRVYLSDMLKGRRPFQEKYARDIAKISQGKVTLNDIVKSIQELQEKNE